MLAAVTEPMRREGWQPHALAGLAFCWHVVACDVKVQPRDSPRLWECWKSSGPCCSFGDFGLGKGAKTMGLHINSNCAKLAEVLLL